MKARKGKPENKWECPVVGFQPAGHLNPFDMVQSSKALEQCRTLPNLRLCAGLHVEWRPTRSAILAGKHDN